MASRGGSVPFRSGRNAVLGVPLPVPMPSTARLTLQPAPAAPGNAAEPAAALPEVSTAARWVVAAAVFLAISKFHGYVSILAKIHAPLILSVLGLVLLFADMRRWRPADLGKHWVPKCVALIAVIAMFSIPFGIYQGQSLKTFNEIFSRTLLIAIMVWAVARTEKGTLFMIRTLTLTIAVAAWIALSRSRLDSAGRLAGGYAYDPNDIALLGVTGIPLVIWWALDHRNRFRWAILAFLPLLFQVIVKSQSRGGFVGLLAMTLGFVLVGLGPVDKRVKKWARLAGLGIILAIPLFPAAYLDHMRSITAKDDYNRTSVSGRMEVWKRGVGYAVQRPLFGVGIGNFNSAEGRSDISVERASQNVGFKWGTAHNSFVQVLAELGFIGGACFAAVIFGSIVMLVGMHRKSEHVDLLPPFYALSMTGFAACAFFLSWGYYDLTYVMIALATALQMRNQAQTPNSGVSAATQPARRLRR